MSIESNSGTEYYAQSCGIPSDVGVNVNSNLFTGYYYNEPNDYILWGQDTYYPHVSTNIPTQYYFLECSRASDLSLDLQSNKSTNFYFSSSFDCIGFCAGMGDLPLTITAYMGSDIEFIYDEWQATTNTTLSSDGTLTLWEGVLSGKKFQPNPTQSTAKRAKIVNNEYLHADGAGRFITLSGYSVMAAVQAHSHRSFWVIETDMFSKAADCGLVNCLNDPSPYGMDIRTLSTFYTHNVNVLVNGNTPLKNSALSGYDRNLFAGERKYLLEYGTYNNGGNVVLNGVAIRPGDSGTTDMYNASEFWSVGNYGYYYNTGFVNTLPVKLHSVIYMTNPATTVLPVSAVDKVRRYLTDKHNIPMLSAF